MISTIEKLSINSWPALETEEYDNWLLAASKGYSRRANSVKIIGESTLPIEEKIKYCEEFYKKHELPSTFKIIADQCPLKLDSKLEELGYKVFTPTSVMIKELSGLVFGENPEAEICNSPSEKWVDEYCECAKGDSKNKTVFLSILNKIKNNGVWITYRKEGRPAGFGFSIVENNYCGIYSILVPAEFRGRGYGKIVMDKLLFESQKLGAEYSYLQVEEGNSPAENLYSKMGYKKIYRYYYMELV